MNKKALLKEIRNHPKGSTMLSLGYSPSFIHGLLIEKMIKESFLSGGSMFMVVENGSI